MASHTPMVSRTAAPASGHGSSTITTTEGPSIPLNATQRTLRLRVEEMDPSEQRRIHWAEDVVDNEGLGKKSSKVCCIYHKPREAGESSSDNSSSSSSDGSDSEPDTSRAQPVNRQEARRLHRQHHIHDHDDDHINEPHEPHDSISPAPDRLDKGKGKAPRAGPNAYEKVPSRPK